MHRRQIIHPLDRPIWNSLTSGWAALALGDGLARRLDPLYGPFAGAADDSVESRAAITALAASEPNELWLVGPDAITPPPGLATIRTAMLAQMVAPSITPASPPPPACTLLDESDAPDMRDLALLTRPGPFSPLTHRLGRFIGLREEGRLVAMAGERMRLPGFTEVSGVCTHPGWRGRGLASALMRIVAQAIVDRGDTPFLHAYAAHDKTIALYRSLGFEVRAELPMMVVGAAAQ